VKWSNACHQKLKIQRHTFFCLANFQDAPKKKCANKGALANHMRFAHGNRIAVESISSFVIRKPPKIIDCFKSLAISTLAMHLVSNASNLGPVPYLRPIFRPFIPAEPEEKVDGRKFNRGEDHRVPINYLLKAKILDEYIEKKKKRIQPTLVQKFKDQRKEGRRVSAHWFKKTARKI